MALLFIDFEWWKDSKGYRLADAEPRELHPLASNLLSSIGKQQRVLPNGGELIAYRPLGIFEKLYKDFANIQAPEDVLRFIERFGPLTDAGSQPELGEEVGFVLAHSKLFRNWLNASQGRGRKKLAASIGDEGTKFANLDASLMPDASGAVRLRILPKNLLAALWVQLAQTLASGMMIRACLHCGQWFEAGPETNRRLDAKFCSDQHRILFNSLKRSEGETDK